MSMNPQDCETSIPVQHLEAFEARKWKGNNACDRLHMTQTKALEETLLAGVLLNRTLYKA